MARRTFTMVDVTEISQAWVGGRPRVGVARGGGVAVKPGRRYVAAAEAAGMVPGGPPVSEEQWRALARGWFPLVAGTGVRQVSWRGGAGRPDWSGGPLRGGPGGGIPPRVGGGAGGGGGGAPGGPPRRGA